LGNSIFGIGLSGLSAAQAGLITTGHNISNANTAGYHRQQIVQSANIPMYTGVGYMGQGVQVTTVTRLYNAFIDGQLSNAQSQSNQLDSYLFQIKQLDNMLADTSAGLSPSLQDFFSANNGLVANAASVPSRQSVLSSAQSLVARFGALNDRFNQIREGVNGQITASVSSINSYITQIANLNSRIMLMQAGSSQQQPNDMLDQRDQLIAELNKEIKVSVVEQDNGEYNVFVGNGQPLLMGHRPFAMSAEPSAADPQQREVYLLTGGTKILMPQNTLQGGTLGGVLAFRGTTLDSAQNALGRVAIGLAQAFNDQHQLGQDLNGNLGLDFFNVASPKVIPSVNNSTPATTANVSFSDVGLLTTSDYSLRATGAATFTLTRLSDGAALFSGAGLPQTVDGITIGGVSGAVAAGDSFLIQPTRNGARDISVAITDPTMYAAAAPIRTLTATANAGTGVISAGSVNAGTPVTPNPAHPSTDLNLQQPVTITFTGAGTFDVTGVGVGLPAVGQVYTSGNPITYNGWTVQISGVPGAGDTFTVEANSGGVSDNRNALLLGELQTKSTLDGNSTSFQGAYGRMVSEVGNKTQEVAVTGKAQENLVTQIQQTQQSLSGVNLDEEAADMMRYQQAYQAAAKAMQIASTLFDTLMSLGPN
jgi:flagellar hook-associated protein 1 FlgK